MPLTEKVEFLARVQRFNRVQIPKLVRWRYKIESWQILKVTVWQPNAPGLKGEYLTRISKDGRITIPKHTITPLMGNRTNQETYLLKITLEPS